MSQDIRDRMWFVRRRGQVLGPFSVMELSKLRDRGNLAAFDEVSEDRNHWIRYEQLTALLEPKQPEQPAPAAPVGASFVPSSAITSSDYRAASLGLAIVRFGLLVELLAGMCLLGFFIVAAVDGKIVVATVMMLLWIGLTLAFEIVLTLGFGIACGRGSDSDSKSYPVACLVLQIVDFLLFAILVILTMISGSIMQMVGQAQEPVLQVAAPLLFGARLILWVPMTVVLIEWLRSLALRVEKSNPTVRASTKSIGSLSTFFYVLYAVQNLALALGFLLWVLFEDAVHLVRRTNDKAALTFLLVSVVYVMLSAVVGIWRIALVEMTRRCMTRSNAN